MSCCSECFRSCFRALFGGAVNQPNFSLAEEYEEEEFITPQQSAKMQKKQSSSFQKTDEKMAARTITDSQLKEYFEDIQSDLHEQMNVRLDLEETSLVVDIHQEEENMRDFQQETGDIDFSTFSINLDPLDRYYGVLSEKTYKLKEYLNAQGQPVVIEPCMSGLQISSIEITKTVTLLLKYSLKCSYTLLNQISKNDGIQLGLCPQLGEARVLQEFKSNLTLNCLRFKRFGILEARQFVYLKYSNGLRGQHWDVFLNDEHTPSEKTYKRCEIFSIRHCGERGGVLHVTQSVSLNLKCENLSAVLPRLIGDIRKYVQSLYEHVQAGEERERRIAA